MHHHLEFWEGPDDGPIQQTIKDDFGKFSNLLHHLEPETVKFIDVLETIFFQEVQPFQRVIELILE